MAALSHARTSFLVLKISLLLFLVLSIEQHTDQWKNHCANSKQVRNNLLKKKKISVDLDIREHLEIGTCLNGFESTRRKFRCRGRSYTLATTPHSTDQRIRFNPVMLKMCGDEKSNPGPINNPCRDCGKNVRNIKMQFCVLYENAGLFDMKCLQMSSSVISDSI